MDGVGIFDPDERLTSPSFSPAEFARRDNAVADTMRTADVHALILYGTPGLDSEIQYLADFQVTREAVLVYPLSGSPTLYIEYFNHAPHARRVVRRCNVQWGGADIAAMVAADLRARGLEATRVGYVGLLPTRHYLALRAKLPRATFVDLSDSLRRLRLVKSSEELLHLREGARLTDRAVRALAERARPGMTEHELISIVEGAYVSAGGQTGIHYLASTSMADPKVSVPAQQPSNRRLQVGDVIITEISAQYRGYSGQILRSFTVGSSPTPHYQRMYDVAVEAFERIAATLKAGATSEDVLDIAEYIHTEGYTICDDLLHGYGGGYLPPILRTRRTGAALPEPFTFHENMTVVIQPNVITEDGHSGVQVGELVRVTRTGVERMHTYPMTFTRCG